MPWRSKLRSRDFIELAICYGLILSVIWTSRPTQRFLYWITFAWIVVTTLLRCPDAKKLGLRSFGQQSTVRITVGGLLFAGLIVVIAREFHTLHVLHGGVLGLHIAGYILWAFGQQFILQDYFLLRLLRMLSRESEAVVVAGLLFSIAHLPNPVLTAATLAWGIVACALFLRYRNLYALGFVHGVLGLCVAISLPDSVTHHMMVGLGYLRYR